MLRGNKGESFLPLVLDRGGTCVGEFTEELMLGMKLDYF